LFVVLTALFRSVMSYDNFHLPRGDRFWHPLR
jgi:hypothetical protein